MAACVILIVLVSACAVVMEASHDCEGADCDICRIIGSVIGAIRLLTFAAVVCCAGICADAARRMLRFFESSCGRLATPVTEKVRLLN